MNKVSIILALSVIVFIVSCGDKDKRKKFIDPIKYNAYIVKIIDDVDSAWTTTLEETDKAKALAWSDTLANRSKAGLVDLNNLQPFKKDSTFRDASINYLTHMNNVANKELKEFINIIRSDELTIEGEQRTEDLIPILDNKREELFAKTEKAQNDFADKFQIKIKKP